MKDPGLSTLCKIRRVIEGDTVEVKIERVIRVRLQDCWALQKDSGRPAFDYLKSKVEGKEAILFVPQESGSGLLFDKAVGLLWLQGEKESLNEQLVTRGLAAGIKPEQ